MSDIQKKVLIDVQIAGEDADAALNVIKTDVDALKASADQLKISTLASKAATAELTTELSRAKIENQAVKTAIDKARLAQIEANNATREAKKNMVAASGSYAEAQQKLTALGKAIKNTENGFNSSNKAVKAQVAEYNKLNNQLKSFDAQMGNHQRSVGNYGKALEGISGQLDRLIPGFSQLQGALKSAAGSFNVMGSGATQAGEAAVGAEGAVEAGAIAAGVAIAAVAAAIIAEGTYLLQFQKYADGLSKTWAGIKAGSTAAMNAINATGEEAKSTGNWFADLGVKAAMAFTEASKAQGKILETTRLVKMSAVQTAEENDKIKKDMLIIRNIKSDEITVEKAYQDALKLTGDQYERNKKIQDEQHAAIVRKETAAFGLTQKEVDGLNDVKGGYTKIIQLAHDLVAQNKLAASSLDDIIESAKKGVEIEGTQEVREQMIQNREDQKQAKLEKQAAKELAREQKEADMLAKIKQQTEEANSERIASISRMLGFQREAFAKELDDADEHYRQLIFKQRKFIEDQEKTVHSKTATPKEKAAARGAIGAAQADITQLGSEHAADEQRLLEEHGKQMLAIAQQGANDLTNLQIQSIEDEQEREKQSDELLFKEKNQALDKEIAQLKENQTKLTAEIKTATPERKAILQKELEDTQALIDTANDKRVETQLQFQQKQLDNQKKFSDQKQALEDQIAVLEGKGDYSDSEILAAEQKQLLDQYNAEVSSKGLTDEKKLELEKKYLNDKAALEHAYALKQAEKAIKVETQITNAAFQILEQSLARDAQQKQVNLERSKNYELQNQALTTSQKYIIDEKYRVKEGQAKVKQFHQEQDIGIAKAVVNGAVGVQKDIAEWGLPYAIPFIAGTVAETALQVAVIASEKAPAYATGGIYDSDGKGGVLPGYSRKDNMNARLRSGEGIVVSEAMRDPWARQVVSAINQTYGGRAFDSSVPVNWVTPGFASGGVFNNYLPTGDNGLRPQININSSGRMHPDDINGIAQAVSRIPAPVMDIKDLNYQQQRLASATDRLTY